MKRKSLLFMLLFALMAPWAANAQSVQIGDGTGTNEYLPSYSLYNYSVTQQIYTAEEIDASGNITSIAFYNAGSEKARKYNIYMAHTTKSAFESTTDWIALTDANLVYQGAEAVALVANTWTTFTFDTPFAYNGTDNLVIGVLDLTGSWESGMRCRAFTAADQALYKYQDAGAYGIDGTYNGTVQTGTIAATKNQIVLGGIQQAHPAPTGLTATPHPTTADLSWTENGTATQWEVAYKTSAEEEFTTVVVNTNPYTLTGLTGETAYNVKVRAYYSETAQSQWSAVVNFTTQPACPAPTALASSNLTASSATLTWTAGYEESDWVLQYGTSYSFTEGTYTEVTVNGTPTYEVTGLSEFTTYYAHVKADCGGDSQSEWSTMLTFTTKEICPEGKICIGDGTATNSYLPASNYYNYSLTQQIYTAAEIGEAGAILSIDFFKASTTAMAVDLDIYMVSTTKDEFASATDFVPVTSSDLVFSGTVTFADNAWTTIELDAPFIYDGTSNVAIMVDNNTGDYVSSTPFYVFSSDKNQSLYVYSDGTNYDPFAPAFSYRTATKNRIRLAIGEPPACPKPTGIAIDYQGGTEATIRWTSDAEAWNMRVNGTEINGTITNPYTLTGLELATTYEVEVQANCGSSTSEWAGPVSFITDACLPEDMCTLTFELTDSYGDTWNGNAIQVVDALTGAVIGEVTNTTSDHANAPITDIVTLSVCDGRAINFVWVKGNYPGETSWVIKDVNGAEITSGSGNTNMATGDVLANYTVDCTVTTCIMPTDLAAEDVTANSATLSWTSAHNNFEIQYREKYLGAGNDFENGMGAWTTIDADGDGYTWELGSVAMAGYLIPSHDGEDCATSKSYDGDAGALTPDNYLVSPQIELGGSISFWACAQDPDYAAEHFGVAVSTTGNTDAADFRTIEEWTMTAKAGRAITGNYLTRNRGNREGTWYEYTVDLSEYAGLTGYVAIRHFDCTDMFYLNVDGITIVEPNATEPEWITVEGPIEASPYTLTGLNPERTYEVRVRCICGEDDYTDWATAEFPTLPLCQAPTELTVSDITTNSAVISWTSEANSFDVELDGDVIAQEITETTYALNDLDPGTIYTVRVLAHCDEGDSEWSAEKSFLTDCEAFDLPYEYDFDDMLTSDNPEAYCWTTYTWNDENEIAYYYEDDTHTGVMVGFSSTYPIADGESYQQILISPELNTEAALTVSFDYRPNRYVEDTHVESFAVGYLTSLEDFDLEVVDYVEATNPDEMTTYTTTIPAGAKYVAVIYTGENPYTLNGGYASALYVDNFSFTEAGQTIELSAGWNWVSTYIDLNEVDGMALLKEALGDYAITLQAGGETADYFGDGEWVGLEDYVWTNADMIMVEAIEDCTITLAGPIVDPSTVEIEIYPGWNWIGFPVDTETDLEVAMAGFEAEEEDIISSNFGSCDYLGEWIGDFPALVPGQGYMYNSMSTDPDPKTLVFLTGDSKARRNIIDMKPNDLRIVSAPITVKQIKK